LPLSSWSQTTPPCVSCKTKPKSCALLDALGKKFNTKTDLDYLALFCNASWTDAKLLTVLKEINDWSSDARQKEFITQFGTTDAFRNGIVATPNLVYGWAVLQTPDLTQLATVQAWKTTYPVLFADLKTLDKTKQAESIRLLGAKRPIYKRFRRKRV
jgi:hypothetical protein